MTINLPRPALTAACAALLLATGACDRWEAAENKGDPAPPATAVDTTAAEKAVAEAKADTAEPAATEAPAAPETPPPAEKK